MRKVAATAGPPVLVAGGLLGLWWAVTAAGAVRPVIVPPPARVAVVFTEQTGYLLRSTATTAAEAGAGYALAAGLGLVIGGLLASSPPLARAMLPTLVALDAIPKLAVAPLLILWLGFGIAPKLVIVIATCLLPVVLATIGGLTTTPTDYVELGRSLTAPWWRILLTIRLPAAWPRIFVGLRISAPLAVIGAVVAEFFGAVAGLGYAIRAAGSDAALVWAALLVLGALSLTLYYTVLAVERVTIPWARHITA